MDAVDIAYQVDPRVVSSIKSATTMIVHGPGTTVELPVDLFQLLMEFAEPRTVREAFEALERMRYRMTTSHPRNRAPWRTSGT